MGIPADAERALRQLKIRGKAHLQRRRPRRRTERTPAVPPGTNGSAGQWAGRGPNRQLQFTPYEASGPGPRRPDLSVGVILDDFTRTSFAFEWNLLELRKELWRDQLGQTRIDFLFVESAWNGNSGSWQYQLTGSKGPGVELVRLVEWCRARGIPTVFWNKEDPPHYDDFLPAAKLFDHVFTSDSDRIPDYVRDLGPPQGGHPSLCRAARPPQPRPARTRMALARRGFRRNVFRPQVPPTPRPDGHAPRRGHGPKPEPAAPNWKYSPASWAGTRTTSSRSRSTST